MTEILAMFTCFNRKDKTKKAIESIVKSNPDCNFTFVVADDNSKDGTQDVLKEMSSTYKIYILKGDGNLFYSGGMRMAMDYAIENLKDKFDYLLIMNDDVEFLPLSIEKSVKESKNKGNCVIVGTTKDSNGDLSYGAVKYTNGIKYKKLDITDCDIEADTFNANCVLIPYEAFKKVGSIDKHYIHSLGDFDFGLSIKNAGYKLYPSSEYVGICDNNSAKGTWTDTSLSIKERIKKKENIKGAPTKQWFYFLNKNFGFFTAVKSSVTPYIRIFIGK